MFCGKWYLSHCRHNGILLLISIFTFWSTLAFHSVTPCQILSKSPQSYILQKVWFLPHHHMAISVCTKFDESTFIGDGDEFNDPIPRQQLPQSWILILGTSDGRMTNMPAASWISNECYQYVGPRNPRMGSMYLQTKLGANRSRIGRDTPVSIFSRWQHAAVKLRPHTSVEWS